MISMNYDIREFFEANKGKSRREVLYLLDKEATEAERLLYRKHTEELYEREKVEKYVNIMKTICLFMKCSVRPFGDDEFLLKYLGKFASSARFSSGKTHSSRN